MGENKAKKRARQREEQAAQLQLQLAQQAQQQFLQRGREINPFGQQLLGLGQGALRGEVPAFLERSIRDSLAQNFGQARQSLVGLLGRTGQGLRGLGTGPLANLFGQEAQAGSQAKTQALLQALNLGTQGANILGGQQAAFNPAQFFPGATQSNLAIGQLAPPNLLGQIGGAVGGAALGAIPFGKIGTSIFGGK